MPYCHPVQMLSYVPARTHVPIASTTVRCVHRSLAATHNNWRDRNRGYCVRMPIENHLPHINRITTHRSVPCTKRAQRYTDIVQLTACLPVCLPADVTCSPLTSMRRATC